MYTFTVHVILSALMFTNPLSLTLHVLSPLLPGCHELNLSVPPKGFYHNVTYQQLEVKSNTNNYY